MNRCLLFIHNKDLKPLYKIDAEILDKETDFPIRNKDQVCVNSEASLEAVYQQMVDGNRKKAIDLLKDKFLFRSAIAPLFPDFHFSKSSLKDIRQVERKSILKPVKGFFSAGVRIIEPGDDIETLKIDVERELDAYGAYFSKSVLSKEEWLVEDYIEGEELAVDLFFNSEGKPIILNIIQHPMPSDASYLNVVYWTSEELFHQWKRTIEIFVKKLNDQFLHVKHFPLHAEFRIQGDKLIPIEINPLRFGGFCLADLPYYAFGLNPYDIFFKDQAPNWELVWSQAQHQFYCWVLGYNGKGINVKNAVPCHSAFQTFCGEKNIAFYRKMNWQKEPIFAIAYLHLADKALIAKLLKVDFNQFFLEKIAA